MSAVSAFQLRLTKFAKSQVLGVRRIRSAWPALYVMQRSAASIMEGTLKKETLGAQLARRRAKDGMEALAERTTEVNAPTATELKRIQALFDSARSRLRKMVRLAVSAAEVELVGTQDELETLERSCAPVRWTLAIEAPAHPFHAQWQAFRRWAAEENLVVQLVETPHPVLVRMVYVVRASAAL